MSTQSWQIPCPRCGWANSGALTKCAKCGQPLGARPGMLVAGQSMGARPERPVTSKVARPGGFLPRLVALIIDTVILAVVILPLYSIWTSQLVPIQVKPGVDINGELLQRQVSFQVAVLALQVFYFAGSWTMMGGTPGQLLLNLRVTNARAEGIGFFRAVLRWFVLTLFGPINAIFLVLKQKRGLHDMMAGTYVIQIVDSASFSGDTTGLPPAAKTPTAKAAAAPAPPPAPAPVPAPLPVAAAPAPAPAPAPVAPAYSPPPAAEYPPPVPPPAVPPPTAHPAPTYSPPPAAPPIAFPPAPLAAPAHQGRPESDADSGLYSPPPMEAAPAGEREIYSPPPPAPLPVEVPPPPARPSMPPVGEQELPPIEFPPMTPPPK